LATPETFSTLMREASMPWSGSLAVSEEKSRAQGPGILDNVAAELNARPRKHLGWRTPQRTRQTTIKLVFVAPAA
jgi:hypothetical protein